METLVQSPTLHLRFDGTSSDIPLHELDVGNLSSDAQIRSAVAEHVGIPLPKLQAYVVDRNAQTGDITLRPDAVFG